MDACVEATTTPTNAAPVCDQNISQPGLEPRRILACFREIATLCAVQARMGDASEQLFL